MPHCARGGSLAAEAYNRWEKLTIPPRVGTTGPPGGRGQTNECIPGVIKVMRAQVKETGFPRYSFLACLAADAPAEMAARGEYVRFLRAQPSVVRENSKQVLRFVPALMFSFFLFCRQVTASFPSDCASAGRGPAPIPCPPPVNSVPGSPTGWLPSCHLGRIRASSLHWGICCVGAHPQDALAARG